LGLGSGHRYIYIYGSGMVYGQYYFYRTAELFCDVRPRIDVINISTFLILEENAFTKVFVLFDVRSNKFKFTNNLNVYKDLKVLTESDNGCYFFVIQFVHGNLQLLDSSQDISNSEGHILWLNGS
jgi:hypothetical protein